MQQKRTLGEVIPPHPLTRIPSINACAVGGNAPVGLSISLANLQPIIDPRRISMRLQYAMVALALAATASMAAAAYMPESVKAPAEEILSLQSKAIGVQIYTCRARKDDPYRYEWTFKAPEAELYDGSGKRIGRHYGGPTWELDDGSKVVGEVKRSDDGPDANAIAWLLLTAKSNSGTGVLGRTTNIQRVDTIGGRAPADGCEAKQEGRELRVPYTATYNFFGAASVD
jgi:hypothetical protein